MEKQLEIRDSEDWDRLAAASGRRAGELMEHVCWERGCDRGLDLRPEDYQNVRIVLCEQHLREYREDEGYDNSPQQLFEVQTNFSVCFTTQSAQSLSPGRVASYEQLVEERLRSAVANVVAQLNAGILDLRATASVAYEGSEYPTGLEELEELEEDPLDLDLPF